MPPQAPFGGEQGEQQGHDPPAVPSGTCAVLNGAAAAGVEVQRPRMWVPFEELPAADLGEFLHEGVVGCGGGVFWGVLDYVDEGVGEKWGQVGRFEAGGKDPWARGFHGDGGLVAAAWFVAKHRDGAGG